MDLVDVVMPSDEDGYAEAVVMEWFKKEGDPVTEHEPLLEVSTDKVTIEVPAPASGVLHKISVETGQSISNEDVLGQIAAGAEPEATAPSGDEASTDPASQDTDSANARASQQAQEADGTRPDPSKRLSPLVKRMLREHDLDPATIKGTGKGGRITQKDVQAYLEQPPPSDQLAATPEPEPASPPPSAAPPAPALRPATQQPSGDLDTRMVPHTPMRRRIAQHMVESMLQTAPHVTALFDVDLSAVIEHRRAHKDSFAARGVRLTFTPYFVAAAVEALHAVPEVNSRWHDDALEIFRSHNIGIATALDREGLIVPVIRDAQDLGLNGIANRLQELTNLARTNKLSRQDLQGGTFTITNHGGSGSLLATPIINQPQSAILGIGKIEKRVRVREERGKDLIEVLPMAYVTLTIDHRALDGFHANQFLSRFVEVLESWT